MNTNLIPQPQKQEKIPPHEPGVTPNPEPIIENDKDLPPGTPQRTPEELPGNDNLEHAKRHVH